MPLPVSRPALAVLASALLWGCGGVLTDGADVGFAPADLGDGADAGDAEEAADVYDPQDADAEDARDGGQSDADAGIESPIDGGDTGTDDAGPIDGGSATGRICPPGSERMRPNLSGATLRPVPGVPLDDGFVTGFAVVEGPMWRGGSLYFTHFGGSASPPSRILRLDLPSGAVFVANADAGLNGLALGPSGEVFGARHRDGAVVRIDLGDGSTVAVADRFDGVRFNSPNDLVVRSDGTIYFTDPSWQAPNPPPQTEERAYRIPPSGPIEALPNAPARPNGVALSLDERQLFVTGTSGMRVYQLGVAGQVVAGPMDVPGIGSGLDGLGLDCAGHLYVAGEGRIRVLDPGLAIIGEILAPGATNVAFGGEDRETLFVTALGAQAGLYSVRLGIPGLPN